MEYTVDYFIKKFEAIPYRKWCIGKLVKNIKVLWWNRIQCCAQGHCFTKGTQILILNKAFPFNVDSNKEAEFISLMHLFNAVKDGVCMGDVVGEINNGRNPRYQQPTPKQRILAALYDIKKMQQPETPAVKVKTVYVSVPESITEQTKELILS